MENKTSTYRVEQKLTAATIHEFLAKTKYRVVSDTNGGDAVLSGKVLRMEVVAAVVPDDDHGDHQHGASDGDAGDDDLRSDIDGPRDG